MNTNRSHARPASLHSLLALFLVFLSFFLSALVSRTVFERMPHLEDEVTYLYQSRLLLRGQTVIDSPEPSLAFWQPFVVDHNGKRFGKYPLGWPGMLALGEAAGQPWVINAFLGALTVALVYRLGREIFNPHTGLIAAALITFSPMALLLNGTLMSHTAALFTTTLFMYAYWRMERGRHAARWAVIAGIALGLTIINRPLAGVALGAPFIVWSGVRLLRHFLRHRSLPALRPTLTPLLILSAFTLALSAIIPAYQYAATGDARQNLYLLIWPYDRVGFGEGYGRNTHTLEKGIRQTRWDMSLMAADLFGWQNQPMLAADGQLRPELRDHLLTAGDYWEPVGLSWVLLPLGLLIGLRRRWWWWALWLAFGALLLVQTTNLPTAQLRDPTFAYQWMAGGALWLLLPFAFLLIGQGKDEPGVNWTWLLLSVPLSLLLLHVTYWIGSQRYSTRYYYEGLSALALLSAVPLGWLVRRGLGRLVYPLLVLVLVVTLYTYSTPRITALYRFNWISPQWVQAVESRRQGDRPLLILVSGQDVRWRSFGSLMVQTSPFLDSPIVAARDTGGEGVREQILAQFPDYQIIELHAQGNYGCLNDVSPPECYGETPPAG